jgi:hypothetical protein
VFYLLDIGILEIKTVISVFLTDVGIAVLLYYLLGEHRRGNEEEIVTLADAFEKFGHLKGYSFPVFHRPLRYYFYYVENTVTNKYFRAPQYVEALIGNGVLEEVECKSEKEMREILDKKEM